MDFVQYLLTAIGGAGTALAIAAFLGRHWFRLQIEKALEAYKASLSRRTEVLKTELSIYAHEQNVGLTRIDVQRSEAILSLWAILSSWEEAFLSLTAPNRRLEASALDAVQRYQIWSRDLMSCSDKLSVELRNREILFDESAYATIGRYVLAVSTISNDFFANSYEGIDSNKIQDPEAFLGRIQDARRQLQDSVQDNVAALRKALSREFRVLMGATRATVHPALESARDVAARV